MPTKEVIALLTDAPAAHLHPLYKEGAASIVEAYLVSGFPFLAVDPDHERGFRLPDPFDRHHFPEVVDVVFVTLADLDEIKLARDRPELGTVRAQGSAYFAGRPEDQNATVALQSCATGYEFGIPQAIIPPAAREIMKQVYPELAQHSLDRTIPDQHRGAVADAWAELRRGAKIAQPLYVPAFEHVVSAWSADLPVIVGYEGQNHRVVQRGTTWTQFTPDA